MSAAKINALTLANDGAQLFRAAALPVIAELAAVLAELPTDQAGIRISALPPLRPYLAPDGAIGVLACRALGAEARAVRAILFDKNQDTNWSLAWHQDRTICVRQRVEVQGFGPWTIKGGLHHVAPPYDLLSRMVTLRVHLDDVRETNAPLLIAPGSHRLGRVPVDQVAEIVGRSAPVACLAVTGDVWAYSTLILHASEAATQPVRRRVLQVDFSADALPGQLEWLGV